MKSFTIWGSTLLRSHLAAMQRRETNATMQLGRSVASVESVFSRCYDESNGTDEANVLFS